MSLNDEHMLPAHVRNMRQMNDLLNAEDIVLAQIEEIIERMYLEASLLEEELVNDEWLERKLYEMTGAETDVEKAAKQLLLEIVMNVSDQDNVDIQNIRDFLDKWLPAHLAYKLIFLINYTQRIKEEFRFHTMAITVPTLFWNVRTLDGTWLLDGSYNLDAIRKPDDCGIGYDIGDTELQEAFSMKVNLRTSISVNEWFRLSGSSIGFTSIFWRGRVLDGTWLLDGRYDLSASLKSDSWGVSISGGDTQIEESIQCGMVTMKDLWTLNGRVNLDGTRILDAIRREEDL